MLIYKIFRAPEWEHLQQNGETLGAPVDLADGFVHFSTPAQAGETARRYFADMDDLWLIACDSDALGEALKWEVSRGGEEFPHLFRALRMDDVVWARPLPITQGIHQFPEVAQ